MSRAGRRRGVAVLAALVVLAAAALGALLMRDARERAAHERLLADYPVRYADLIARYAGEYALDPYLVLSIMRAESSFDSGAVSSAGASGLMQIMPETGEWIAGKLDLDGAYDESMLFDPACSVRFGCWFLRFLTDRFDGVRTHIVAAYNAGHGSVEKWLADPELSAGGLLTAIPFPETARYVEKVEAAYAAYRSLYPDLFTDGLVAGDAPA